MIRVCYLAKNLRLEYPNNFILMIEDLIIKELSGALHTNE